MPAIAVLAVVGAAACAGAWARIWLSTSPRFAVTEISVSGNDTLELEAVRAAMGLAEQQNIFGLDLADVETVLEQHPWIREAHVERRLPDRLLVDLVEQRAAALVELGGLYLIDREGMPFKRTTVDREEGLGLVVITGIAREEYAAAPGRAHARFRQALELVDLYNDNEDRPAVGEVNLDDREGTTLFSRDSAVAVRIGTGTTRALGSRLGAFDAAWSALSAAEKQRARVIHANRDTTPQRVSVAFSQDR